MSSRMNFREATAAFEYDAKFGILRWAVPPHKGIIKGDMAGSKKAEGYRVVRYKGLDYPVHRIVWLLHRGEWPKTGIDHIDHDRDNNSTCKCRNLEWNKLD